MFQLYHKIHVNFDTHLMIQLKHPWEVLFVEHTTSTADTEVIVIPIPKNDYQSLLGRLSALESRVAHLELEEKLDPDFWNKEGE